MPQYNILVVDDESVQRDMLAGFLKKKGYYVKTASNGEEAINSIQNELFDAVLLDYRMPGQNGLEVMKSIKKINPEIAVIMMTAYGSIENAVDAVKEGVFDYLTKPINLDELIIRLQKALESRILAIENKKLKEQLKERYKFEHIIGDSPQMQDVLNTVARVANSKVTVLIYGESGTGKELIAQAIHYASPRKDKPFIAINCSALPDNLLESELFGHEKGSFTGADKQRKGRFELANGGTLFLDEVGDISPLMQVKLLRAVQEQKFERVGGENTIQVDVRIISATNKNLEQMVKDGKFREDLYYRLNVANINIPPLRERKEDIVPLIDYFLKKYSKENNKDVSSVSRDALDILMKYDYPGNVRELENIIERAVVMSRENFIEISALPNNLLKSNSQIYNVESKGSLVETLDNIEKELILKALNENDWVQIKTAKQLGISERALRYKMQKYELKK